MKKSISILLSLIMMASVLFGMNITSYAYSAHSSYEAVQWANSQVGKSLDYDNVYGAQCVDVIKYYYSYLGVTPQSGNAVDYAYNTLPSGWTRIRYYNGFVAQPGDIAVWSYLASSYGHIGIVTSADAYTMNLVDQNGSTYPAHIVKTCSKRYSSGTFYGVIRPDFSPIYISDINFYEINPTSIRFSYNINNPTRMQMDKRKTQIRKVGESKWKGYIYTYKTPVSDSTSAKTNVSKNKGCKYTLNENTAYEIRVGLHANGTWYYSQPYQLTTKGRTDVNSLTIKHYRFKYTGKSRPVSDFIRVYDGNKLLKLGTDYTLSGGRVKDIGRYYVTVYGKNDYKGSVKKSISIYPKTPTVRKLDYKFGRIYVTWTKVANCSNQQVAISQTSNFASGKTSYFKFDKSKGSASFYKIRFNGNMTHIEKGRTYYVKMRAYKVVGGKRIYGDWGKTRKIVCE